MKKIFLMSAIFVGVAISSSTVMAGHHKQCQGHQGKMMQMIDTDGDGVVSKAEFMAKHEKHFSKMDTDGNGELSPEEIKAGRLKAKEKMHEHKKMMESKGKSTEESVE